MHSRQSGFTAVELLVTLFVAAGFLIAAYQLFNLVIKDGGATRSESRASNVAYDYLRKYAASSTTIPCTPSSPLNSAPVTVAGLTDVTMSVTVSCLPDAISSLSKVEVAITYNNPAQTVKYATLTSSTGNSTANEVSNGLVAWWKLNGDSNNSVGSPNGVSTNIASTTGQGGSVDTAYAFNGTNSTFSTASTFGLSNTNITISTWVNNPTASNHGLFVQVGATNGYGIGIGSTATSSNGTNLIMVFNGVRVANSSTALGTGWHHVVMTLDGSGTPTAYIDGSAAGSSPGTNAVLPASNAPTTIGGLTNSTADTFNGTIDDARVYNRALSVAEIQQLYSSGAK